MATKLDTHSTKNSRHVLAGKRMTFDRGQPKTESNGLPLKTTETESGVKE